MTHVIRRRLPDGTDVYWAGPFLSLEDHWGARAEAFLIVHDFNAHETARKLSQRFDGQITVEVWR